MGLRGSRHVSVFRTVCHVPERRRCHIAAASSLLESSSAHPKLATCLSYGGQNLVPLAFLLAEVCACEEGRKSCDSCKVHPAVSVDGCGHTARHLGAQGLQSPQAL